MNICFIAGTLGLGGAERQLYYYLKTLKQDGNDLYVLCLTKGDFWEKPIQDLGIPVIWVGMSDVKLVRLFIIIKQISQKPTDIIHSQHFHTNLYGYMAGLLLNKKAIGSLRNDVYSEILSTGPLGKLCLNLPSKLVANSNAAIDNAVSLGKSRNQLFYIPNIVDENYFPPLKKRFISKKLRIISIGTLWPPKRVDKILRLAKQCLDKKLNIEFKIFGDGVQKLELIHMAEELGVLNNNIQFMGVTVKPNLAYQNADILLLTSSHEGTPNVILEAMSCGLPIISTNVGDLPDLITNNENGFLVDTENYTDLFNSIMVLYENRELLNYMGNNNRKKIIEERSFSKLNNYLSDLYKEI